MQLKKKFITQLILISFGPSLGTDKSRSVPIYGSGPLKQGLPTKSKGMFYFTNAELIVNARFGLAYVIIHNYNLQIHINS